VIVLIPVETTANTYPSTADEVAGFVKCAAEAGYNVQAEGGGHSYGNFPMERFVDIDNVP
jgi:FAD/FMN-containing dehydrogenase